MQKKNDIVHYNLNEKNYKGIIYEMVEKIENQKNLEYICTFIKLFLEKWGD